MLRIFKKIPLLKKNQDLSFFNIKGNEKKNKELVKIPSGMPIKYKKKTIFSRIPVIKNTTVKPVIHDKKIRRRSKLT